MIANMVGYQKRNGGFDSIRFDWMRWLDGWVDSAFTVSSRYCCFLAENIICEKKHESNEESIVAWNKGFGSVHKITTTMIAHPCTSASNRKLVRKVFPVRGFQINVPYGTILGGRELARYCTVPCS